VYLSTIGADYLKKDVELGDGRAVRLQLWDIAGQDRFARLTRVYFARGGWVERVACLCVCVCVCVCG
jgi:GTPase SAR1 family protein